MVLTPYDQRSFTRSLAFGLAFCALALAVMWATDGATGSPGGRIARLAALAPVLGAIGAAMARVQGRAKGEPIALQSIGVSPARLAAGSLAAGALLGGLGLVAVCSGFADMDALFPTLHEPLWTAQPDGSWASAYDGVVVRAEIPPLTFVRPLAEPLRPHAGTAPVACMIAVTTLALALWSAQPISTWARSAVGGIAVLTTVLAFHLVAGARVGEGALCLGSAILGLHASVIAASVWLRRRASRQAARHRNA